MPGALLALLADTAVLLTLDARGTAVACPSIPSEEVVVCARRDMPTTRFPIQVEGTSGTVLIEPGHPYELRCNLDFILRSRLKGRYVRQFGVVGPKKVFGSYTLASVRMAGRRDTVVVGWADGTSVRSTDCSSGPGLLGAKNTQFIVGPSRADAREHVLPFSDFRTSTVYAEVPVGKSKIAARFELDHDINVLTAPAARMAAPALGGSTVGPAYLTMVLFGIMRPVRLFETQKPLMLGGHAIPELYVRVDDYGEANGLRTLRPEEEADDDVVSTAKHVRNDGPPLLRVGRSGLAGCVSLTVDERRRKITLVC